jgi:YegS/Rv2252/BmrU family lipid kinase
MTRQALVIVNRSARQGEQQWTAIQSALRGLGIEGLCASPRASESLSQAIVRHQGKVDLVVLGGGDGTLNAAAEGLVEAELPVGIIPLGTANDLAKTLGLPTELHEACRVIASGRTRRIDLGQVNGKYFFNVASIGLGVAITRRLTSDAKRSWGTLAYLKTALQTIWRARPFRAEICAGGQAIAIKTIHITIGNGRHYGGGMTVCQDASIDDQMLDLYSVEVRRWWQGILLLPRFRSGTLSNSKHVRTMRGQSFEIHTKPRRRVNTDGEITCRTPAFFRVVPGALSVFIPEACEGPVNPSVA